MVQKDYTQIFAGLFFFISLIYFIVMYFSLKDIKASNINNIYANFHIGYHNPYHFIQEIDLGI